MVAAIELAVSRLAVPGLKPTDPSESPPLWHTGLSYFGLFLSYFGSVLAVGIILRQLILFARGHHPYWQPIAYALVLVGAAFTTYAMKSLIGAPGESETLLLELCFSLALLLLVAAQLKPGGDAAAKVGLLLLAAPLLVHFYRDAGVRWVLGDEALVSGLPERIAASGQWSMVLAALLSPYCFAPRPFMDSAGRLAPLVIGAFVGVTGAFVMRHSAEVGVKIASEGLGVDLGSGPPASQIALYLIALGSITWTLVACFIAPSAARRRIGVGLGLVVAAGYAFDWPLQYLVGLVGFMTIGQAIREVVAEEQAAHAWATARFRRPSIPADVWQAYVVALVEALRGRGMKAQTVSVEDPALLGPPDTGAAERPAQASAAPVLEEASRTHVLITDAAAPPVRLLVERVGGAVHVIEVVCGRDLRATGESPGWTLEARPERRMAPRHASAAAAHRRSARAHRRRALRPALPPARRRRPHRAAVRRGHARAGHRAARRLDGLLAGSLARLLRGARHRSAARQSGTDHRPGVPRRAVGGRGRPHGHRARAHDRAGARRHRGRERAGLVAGRRLARAHPGGRRRRSLRLGAGRR